MSRRSLTTAACCLAGLVAAAPAAEARVHGHFPHYRGTVPTLEGHVAGVLNVTRVMAVGPQVVAIEDLVGTVSDRRYPWALKGAGSGKGVVTVHHASCARVIVRIGSAAPHVAGIPAHTPTLTLPFRSTRSSRKTFCRLAKLAAAHLPPLTAPPPQNGQDQANADAAQAPPPVPPGESPTPPDPVLAAHERVWDKHMAAMAQLIARILHLAS